MSVVFDNWPDDYYPSDEDDEACFGCGEYDCDGNCYPDEDE